MDAEIVERAKAGDRAAMERLLRAVAPTIRRFALRMCRNEADADDVLQDSLFSIATHLGQFEGRSSLPSWTFALARSACSRKRRGKKNQSHDDLDTFAATDQAVARGPGPDDRAASAELSRLVESALDQLPDEYREVLLLRDGEGLTAPEAAVALGISLEALKSRLHRARKSLREVLRPILEKGQEDSSTSSAPATPAEGCPDVVRALSEKLEDDLDPSACAAMEKHVSSCPSCAQTCDALKDALHACRSVETATLSPELQEYVRSAIARWVDSKSRA